jgi:hypothetical protein
VLPWGSGLNSIRSANLTPAGELGRWTDDDFITTIRTGVTPSGCPLSDDMPWKSFAKLHDDELQAVWMWLQTLPPARSAPPG